MTIPELKALCEKSRKQGLSKLYISVKVPKAPRSESIRLTGFGNGTVLGLTEHDAGGYSLHCSFSLSTVERNIVKHEQGKVFK